VTLREIGIALKAPFRISSGEVRERRALLLELESAEGARTWSECVAFQYPNYSSETVDTAWLALTEWLLPRLLGVALPGPESAHAILEAGVRGHRMAKAALEMGLWGLAAEQAGARPWQQASPSAFDPTRRSWWTMRWRQRLRDTARSS
jgi:o-succinylbenzoate synthase